MKKPNTWICSKCGTENSEEFEICYQCGNLNRIPQTGQSPRVETEKPKPPKKKSRKWIAAVPVLVVAIVLGTFGVYHLKASQAYNQGDYAAADALARRDPLFSKSLTEAGQVEDAVALYDQGSFSDSLEICRAFPENETAAEYADLCCVALAEEALSGNKLSDARDYISQVSRKEADVAKLNDEIYTLSAEDALLKENTGDASKMLSQVIDTTYSAQYRNAVISLSNGEYYEAILTAKAAAGNAYNQISEAKWDQIVSAYLKTAEEESSIGLEACFPIAAAKSHINGSADFAPEKIADSASEELRSFLLPVDQDYSGYNPNMKCKLTDISDLGKGTDGKILVLWEMDYYTAGLDTEYFIAWDVMELLPHEKIPGSLEEVQHVITIKCLGYKEGWYSGTRTVDAVRERAQLTLSTSGKRVKSTSVYVGPTCPSTVYGMLTDNVFGGLPADDIYAQFYQMVRPLVNGAQ